MESRTIGIDLGKTVFHLVGLNAAGDSAVDVSPPRRKRQGKSYFAY